MSVLEATLRRLRERLAAGETQWPLLGCVMAEGPSGWKDPDLVEQVAQDAWRVVPEGAPRLLVRLGDRWQKYWRLYRPPSRHHEEDPLAFLRGGYRALTRLKWEWREELLDPAWREFGAIADSLAHVLGPVFRDSPHGLWLPMVFRLAWQRPAGSTLRGRRFRAVEGGLAEVGLGEDGPFACALPTSLWDASLAALDLLVQPSATDKPAPDRPQWDRARRVLTCGAKIARRYERDAPNQFAILDAFEQLGWPATVANPLGGFKGAKELRNAVADLNRGTGGIRFRVDAIKKRLCWSPS